jgi:hypothetical protein
MKKITTTIALAAALLGGTVTVTHAAGSNGTDMPAVGSELATVRKATAGYHRLDAARDAGFAAFSIDPLDPDTPTCFDNVQNGGMGVHYVKGIDEDLDPSAPEAMVYELTDQGPRLVAVEYIVPDVYVDPAAPPSLFGQELHHHSFLPVYILHAWVWKDNPAGMFADFNPNVGPCPSD